MSTRLQQVRQYPVDALEPVIETRSSTDSSIARLVLSARPPTVEVIRDFGKQHPALQEDLEYVANAMNSALAREFTGCDKSITNEVKNFRL